MAKKSRGGKTTQRHARDLQTPAPTEKGSDSESQRAETSKQAISRANVKDPARKARFARSPTREDDFAPNAGDYDSNDSNEESIDQMEGVGDIVIPEDNPDTVSPWVLEIIQRETSAESEKMLQFFRSKDPQYQQCEEFFEKLNGLIRRANQEHEADLENGVVNSKFYTHTCATWREVATEAAIKGSAEEYWSSFNDTRNIHRHFNKRHFLPDTWILSQALAEETIGTPNPVPDEATGFTHDSDNGQPTPTRQPLDSEVSSAESDIDVHREEPTGLDALEARTRKQQRQLSFAKVLYWWPKGTGSQIFVRYGSRSNLVYRIRARSYETYD
jgi:hypothetical protein